MRPLFLLVCAFAVHAADRRISNDKIEVTILKLGGSITSVVLKSDKTKLNPLWQPEQHNFGGYGHLCVSMVSAGPRLKKRRQDCRVKEKRSTPCSMSSALRWSME